MKKLLMAMTLSMASSFVLAGVAKPIYVGNPSDLSDVSTQFVFQTDTGRAWVHIVGNRLISDEPYQSRVNVNGLRYNADKAQVVFAANGNEWVCAVAAEHGIGPFKRVGLRPTGQCPIRAEAITTQVDTGFDLKQLQQVQLILAPQSSES
jgi:hypothetical protein